MLALLFAALVAQVSPTPSPSSAPVPLPSPIFAPPSSWQAQADDKQVGNVQFFGMWFSNRPQASGENITINGEPRPAGATDDQIINQTKGVLATMPVVIVSAAPHKVCAGTKDGYMIELTVSQGSDKLRILETTAIGPSAIYTAAYTRAIDAPADKDALAALDSLCSP